MPGVYKLKQCPRCNASHRLRGKYCSQSCANSGRQISSEQRTACGIAMKKHRAWYETLSPLKKLELRENTLSKKLVSNLRNIIEDCNEIIESLKEDLKPREKYVGDNPADPHLIKLIYVACPPDHHVDHIIPRARGGQDHQNNFQYLYWQDNLRKQDRLESELEELGEFTLRKIDWIEAMNYDEANKCYTIKEEWMKEKILSHPLYTLKDKTEQTNDLIDELIEQTSPNYHKKLTPEQINLIIELKEKNEPDNKIAEILGVSRKTIWKYTTKLGLSTAHRITNMVAWHSKK